jgi:quinol monooxygenase YgiN
MLKHVVTWNLQKPEHKVAHIAVIKEALEGLRGRVPGLLAIEVGTDIGYDRDHRDVILYSEFVDRAALDTYQQHPLHLAAKQVVGALVTARSVVDWEA